MKKQRLKNKEDGYDDSHDDDDDDDEDGEYDEDHAGDACAATYDDEQDYDPEEVNWEFVDDELEAIQLDAIDDCGFTSFHMACMNGDLKTAQMFVQKSVEFKFDLNTKSAGGYTAFQLACINGHSEIAEMLKMKSEEFNIDLELSEESETA